MRILFLTQGTTIPSSRFRVLQFLPHFEAAGFTCTVHAGYDERYNAQRAAGAAVGYRLAQRARQLVRGLEAPRHDVVFVQKPMLPFTALPERLVHGLNPRTIFDVDDAIWVDAASREVGYRRRVFTAQARLHAAVICGNAHIAAQPGVPADALVIPTVVDTDLYLPAPAAAPGRGSESASGSSSAGVVRLGWMGTATNFCHLDLVREALLDVLQAHPQARLRIVSNADYEPLRGHPQVEQPRWTAATELEELRRFDVGLMPLDDIAISRGKCAFKMLQYMAVGVPYIASPVGANLEVHEVAAGGLTPRTPQEWITGCSALITSHERRTSLGGSGRDACVASYSVQAVLPRYLELFSRVAACGEPAATAR